jgi:hypothetical protein
MHTLRQVWICGLWAGLAACQVATPQTGETTQALSGCAGAAWPTPPAWNGKAPTLAAGQFVIVGPDHDDYVAVVADWGSCTIDWNAEVKGGSLVSFMSTLAGQGDPVHVVPPTPPKGDTALYFLGINAWTNYAFSAASADSLDIARPAYPE